MLRVAEHAERTDTGRHRRTNEDAYVARAPLFAVADGMGGAQAGEVASRTAVEVLGDGLPGGEGSVEDRLRGIVQGANERIYALSVADEERAGMGTTLTLAHVGERDVTVAHVGDSRCYRLRDGGLERLTVDHTLVEELVRQGRLDPGAVVDHPQRSIVTRVLGPEALVRVDSHTFPGRDGDVFLLCSDGLTSMVDEQTVAATLRDANSLKAAATTLVKLANDAGGRDNITVVLFRLEELAAADHDAHTEAISTDEVRAALAEPATEQHGSEVAEPATEQHGSEVAEPATEQHGSEVAEPATEQPRSPLAAASGPPPAPAPEVERRVPRPPAGPPARRRGRRVPGGLIVALVLGAILIAGGYLATQAVYFVGVDDEGFVTVYRGVPYDVLGVSLYGDAYVSGVSAAQLTQRQRQTVVEHELRSREDADDLVRQFELGRVGGA